MTCLTLMKNQLTENQKINITKVKENIDFHKWISMAKGETPSGF